MSRRRLRRAAALPAAQPPAGAIDWEDFSDSILRAVVTALRLGRVASAQGEVEAFAREIVEAPASDRAELSSDLLVFKRVVALALEIDVLIRAEDEPGACASIEALRVVVDDHAPFLAEDDGIDVGADFAGQLEVRRIVARRARRVGAGGG